MKNYLTAARASAVTAVGGVRHLRRWPGPALALALMAAPGVLPGGEGGIIRIPAHAFDRGNVRAIASGSYADAEPVVVNGGAVPNWMEYEIDFPVSAPHALHALYTAVESRPVDVLLDGVLIARGFRSVTGSWQSSAARWEKVCDLPIERGKHTLRLQCPGPCIPHIVALRLESERPFPEGWSLSRPGARKLDDRLGNLSGPIDGKDGYEAFRREDGRVDVPDEYNPIIRFQRRDPPVPAAHRILEYSLIDAGRYSIKADIIKSPGAAGDRWSARLAVKLGEDRTDSAVLPLSEDRLRGMLHRALELIEEFRRAAGPGYLEDRRLEAEALLDRASALEALEDHETRWERFYRIYLAAYQLENRVALSNPLLDFGKLVFVKRRTYDTSHIYTTYFDGSNRFGGNLYLLEELRPGAQPVKIVEELGDDGIYRDPDVSWDGSRVLFAHKPPRQEAPYRIYEVGIDGGGLRRLTDSPYDDIDPAYLPNGRIIFVSTRPQRVVLCHNAFTVSVLHTMDAEGGDIRCISVNTVSEFTPSVGADGGILYTRWEYVDKNVGNNQSLWRARPDGTFAAHLAGAHWGPVTFWEPRQVPGSRLLVCTLAPHMPIAVGPIALVDPLDACRSPARFTNLTPELPPPHHFGWHRSDVGYYTDPYPLSEDAFIVSYSYGADPRDPSGYGLYVLDRRGNRDLLYRDPATSCFEAMPAAPRPRPPVPVDAGGPEDSGTFIVLDVYQGLEGVERGAIKHLRVIEEVPKPVSAECRGFGLQHPLISRDGNFAVKRLLGTVPVEADGSAHFRAPAAKALYFAALDGDFMEVQRMRSFVHVEPGQTVACIGCHEDRRAAPPNRTTLAQRRPASEITPPPGGIIAPDFYRDVQPVLDRHCAPCHSGDRIEGGVDLSGDYTNLFNVAYETLTSGYVNYVNINSSESLSLRPPRYYGSHASKLIEVLRGSHRDYLELPGEDYRRIVTWIDLNAPYYGTYRYSRAGTVGGRELLSGKTQAVLGEVYRRRCASCHGGDPDRARRIRYPGIERSPALLMPLAKDGGGAGRCTPPPFAGKDDPDYRRLLEALESLRREVDSNPREDMLAERPEIADKSAPYRYR